ncbi:hypothetical protein BCV71DRAFT_240170, partial [Rhizopus microsporus]
FTTKTGKGSAIDEFKNEVISMKVDEEQYPWVALQILMNIWTLNHLNASKRSVPIFKKVKCSPRRKIKKGTYRVYGDDIKEHFFCLIYEKGLTAGKAGKQLNIPRRTAYSWFEKDQK